MSPRNIGNGKKGLTIFLFLIILFIMISSPFPSTMGSDVLSSAWSTDAVNIDGTINHEEWGEAYRNTLSFITLYLKNDESTLFFAFEIYDVNDQNDALYLYFDEGENGGLFDQQMTVGDEDFKWSAAHGSYYSDRFYQSDSPPFWEDDSKYGGTIDGEVVWLYHTDHWEIEWSIPLNAETKDLNVNLLDSIGFSLRYWDEEDFVDSYIWPSNSAGNTNPETWGEIHLSEPLLSPKPKVVVHLKGALNPDTQLTYVMNDISWVTWYIVYDDLTAFDLTDTDMLIMVQADSSLEDIYYHSKSRAQFMDLSNIPKHIKKITFQHLHSFIIS